ncbi:MAG: trigger factor [SAR86 cluster bacterium]|uniref:Trigger factor n=1 Tax=SAR86 cluster bacterium TaxID=2030880 RepID=A0A937LZV7_9GAMM|nr:trigger factor [SAR86 cluster bacterium]MDG1203529.1 trigger factor [SAR86 cluster bacterium]MDG1721766.1 trigger factor [SAR86 cluster bacterium]|tara:strand:- start:2718 stop:4016 length:1299 start_codon:yes stop_codon:yes gene_type:complete
MTSKLKKLKDLERKLDVSLSVEEYKAKFDSKINKIKGTAKLDGFRKGKVPVDVLEQRYGPSVHADVINELIQDSYPKELAENKLKPACVPSISIESDDPAKPIKYSAVFEVFPEIKVKISRWSSYEKHSIEIEDADLDLAIDDIRGRYGDWEDVTRKSQNDDQLVLDFEGRVNGEEFEGNSAKEFKLVLGSKSMIPGFEDSLLDKEPDSEFTIVAKFPDDYFKQDLAGKDAEFDIKLLKVQENKLAEINKDLFEKLSMEVEDESAFRTEIKSRMDKEVEAQEKALTKESIYELLLKSHSFKAPNATVGEQSELMRKDALMRIGQSVENAEADLFPLESFAEDASKRVRLDLLFAELIKFYEIKVENDKLKEFIAEEAKKYKDPEQFEAWVVSQPKQLEQFNMMILENQLIEKLENDLKSKNKVIKFSELANK